MELLYLIFAALLGLAIGSFLNVVIYRYPIMLKHSWALECADYLKTKAPPANHMNLLSPRSSCPHCGKQLKIWHNIPLISYLFLKARSNCCGATISIIYPIVEALTAIVTVMVVLKFGVGLKALAAIVFSWGLIVLSFIDLKEKLLPDLINFCLLWLGLFCSIFNWFTTPAAAILAAISGYLMLWCIAKVFKLLRNVDGMGYGDFKMLAMLGAWVGIGSLLNVIMLAVTTALLCSLPLLATGKISRKKPIPFGPFLAVGGWLSLMYGPTLTRLIDTWLR